MSAEREILRRISEQQSVLVIRADGTGRLVLGGTVQLNPAEVELIAALRGSHPRD